MKKLKEFRKEKKLSQEAMAKLLGITLSMYEKVEGGRAGASAAFMRRFKDAFPDQSVDDIFFRIEQQKIAVRGEVMDKKELWQEVLQANEEFEQSKKKCKENPTRENMMEKRYCESKVVFAVVQFELACNGTIEGLDKKIKKSMFEIGRLVGLYESYISMEMYCKNKNARIVTFGPQEEDEE